MTGAAEGLKWIEVPADRARTMEPGTIYALVSEKLTDEEKAALSEYLAWFRTRGQRRVTTPFDDPIVQACIDNGGHFWPEGEPDDEPRTCTRCWYNPGWKAGKVVNETELRPVVDRPQA